MNITNKQIKQISFEVSALQNIKDVEEYLKHVKQDSDKFKHLIAYAKAISLFTGGNVASTRDPSKYDQNKAKNWIDVGADQSLLLFFDLIRYVNFYLLFLKNLLNDQIF